MTTRWSVWAPIALCGLCASGWSAETCTSENAKVTPAPAELAKLCPDVKEFQGAPVSESSALQCVYNFALTDYGGRKLPQAWLKVSSDPLKRPTAKEVAEADAKEIAKGGLKSSAQKLPWSGVEAYSITSKMGGVTVPGDLYYVHTSQGVKTVHLKAMNQVPSCVEKVVRWVSRH